MIVACFFPVSITSLAQDCTHRNRSNNGKTSEANIKMNHVQTGLWGGEHISLNVTEQGAEVEYDCAHGSIDGKIIPDADGRFESTGTHVFERGGPVRMGESSDGSAAAYSGQISGDTMTLKVTETATKESVGTFTLTHGKTPRLRKCR